MIQSTHYAQSPALAEKNIEITGIYAEHWWWYTPLVSAETGGSLRYIGKPCVKEKKRKGERREGRNHGFIFGWRG